MSEESNNRRERGLSSVTQLFTDAAVELDGKKFTPDATKAYCKFEICFAWPSISAYGTTAHPATIANSFGSMHDQVFNLGHKMRAYDTDPEKKNIPHDQILGTVVAVSFPRAPVAGWPLASEVNAAPRIQAVAVIHKQAERVHKILGEHLSGRHNWAVSQEINYDFNKSGWVVMDPDKLTGAAADLVKRTTPQEFRNAGLGYVPMADAPDNLIACQDEATGVVGRKWMGSRVALMKGGINGDVHYQGVGLVRYGAEKEANIKQMLASDPNALWDSLDAEGFTPALGNWVQTFAGGSQGLAKLFAK